eukprot:3472651-Prymnesium_polylepis.1
MASESTSSLRLRVELVDGSAVLDDRVPLLVTDGRRLVHAVHVAGVDNAAPRGSRRAGLGRVGGRDEAGGARDVALVGDVTDAVEE